MKLIVNVVSFENNKRSFLLHSLTAKQEKHYSLRFKVERYFRMPYYKVRVTVGLTLKESIYF